MGWERGTEFWRFFREAEKLARTGGSEHHGAGLEPEEWAGFWA